MCQLSYIQIALDMWEKSYWSTKLDLQGSAFKRLQLFCCPLVIFMFLFLLFHCVSTFKYIQLLPSKSGFSI